MSTQPSHFEQQQARLDSIKAMLTASQGTGAVETPVMEPQPETVEGWTDSEVIEQAVELMKLGKTDMEVEAALLEQFDGIEDSTASFIKQARVELSELLKKQEAEIDTAQEIEDDLRKTAAEASETRAKAELKYMREYLEKRLNGSSKKLSDTEVQESFIYQQLVEEDERRWVTPGDLNRTPDVIAFDLNFLPVAIRDRVFDVSERTSTPLDFAGIAAVLCLAGVTGRRAFVFPKARDKEWREAIALSGAIVASSGDVKTPIWKQFTNPIVENDAEWRDEHKKEMKLHQIRVDSWEAEERAARKSKEEFNKPKPEEPPKARRCLINDTTPEAIHSAMQDNPEGYLNYRDELSGFIEELDQEGRQGQRGIFMTAMDGDNTYTMSRIGRGEVSATMCVSLCGNFQPGRLEALLVNTRNIEDGLVPRLQLMIFPKTEYRPTVDRVPNDTAKLVYRRIVRELAKLKVNAVQMHFAPDAQEVFIEWLEKITQRIRSEESEWKKSHLNKYKGGLAKLAGLFQLVDITASVVQSTVIKVNLDNGETKTEMGSPGVGGTHLIDLAHLQQAMDFLDYLESHMHRIYASIKSPLGKAEAALADRIKDGSLRSGFTSRDILRKGWRELKGPDIVAEAIRSLENLRWVRLKTKPVLVDKSKGGRPVGDQWEVNPLLFDKEGGG